MELSLEKRIIVEVRIFMVQNREGKLVEEGGASWHLTWRKK